MMMMMMMMMIFYNAMTPSRYDNHRRHKVVFAEIPILLGYYAFFVRNWDCLHWVPTKSIIPNNMGISVKIH